MNIIHTSSGYFEGGGAPVFNKDFDFLLYRQDFDGTESIYFNTDELNDILKGVLSGEILIHPNYSLLFCDSYLVDLMKAIFPYCYVTEAGSEQD